MRSVAFVFTAAGNLSWAPEGDVTLNAAYMNGTGGDAAISTDPSADIGLMFGGNAVFDQLIALFVQPQDGFRQLSWPVQKGESVFVSADAGCLVVIDYTPAE